MELIVKCLLTTGLILTTGLCARGQSIGPDVFDAAGDAKRIRGITHEYAIGQVVSGESSIFGGLVVTPGVLQPARRVRFLPEKGIASSELLVFPRPVERTIFMQPAFRRGGTLSYALFDAAGKLITRQEQLLAQGTEEQQLDVSLLSAGQYLLRVTWAAGRATPRTTSYKIQKFR